MSDNMGKNAEGYPDPTAGSAWRNIRKEENRREAERMSVINNKISKFGVIGIQGESGFVNR